MSKIHAGWALGLAILLAAPATVAEAADWNNGAGGIKDSRAAGIPVPAPVPVMEHFRWYLRADIGGGILGGSEVSERGFSFGQINSSGLGAQAPFGTSSSWFSSEFDTFGVGSVGVGMYISPRLRGDLTIDARTENEISGSGTYSYTVYDHRIAPAAPLVPTAVATGVYTDRSLVRDTSAMANLYYDIIDRGSFTPYVGVGLGFTNRHIERTVSVVESVAGGGGATTASSIAGTSKANVVAPSASLTAGAAYALHAGLVLDFNYRYMYIGGVDTATALSTGGTSTMKLDPTHEHALRAGVRLNVW
jgi:opacity protein-like surface antigen